MSKLSRILQARKTTAMTPDKLTTQLSTSMPAVPKPASPLSPEAAQAGGGDDDHPFVKLKKFLMNR